MGVDIALLAGYALALFLLILIMETLLHRHMVRRFLRHHHHRHRAKEKIVKQQPE